MPTRVLVVEDDDVIRQLITVNLELEGFEVVTTLAAEAAMILSDRYEFDAAIVDLMLPGVNGIELARQLRERQPGTRVLLTSAYHLSEAQLRKVDCGIVGFIPKPFQLDELVSFLREKIELKKAANSG